MTFDARAIATVLGLSAILTAGSLDRAIADDDAPHPFVTMVGERVEDPQKPFTLIVRMKINTGMNAEFEKAFAPAIEATLKEQGCLQYELSRDTADPTSYLLYERWATLPDLAAHLKTDHIAQLGEALASVRSEPPTAEVHLPVKH